MNKTIIILALLLLSSCSSSVDFVSVMEMPKAQWEEGQWVEFEFENEDTAAAKTINILIRHKPDFEFDRIDMEVVAITPSSVSWDEDISIRLADKSGKWIGRQNSTYTDLSTLYRKGVKFKEKGKYIIKIKYKNSEPILKSIVAVGITIEKNGKE